MCAARQSVFNDLNLGNDVFVFQTTSLNFILILIY